MYLSKIEVTNFRNYQSEKVKLCDKINIFIGNNAQGKTNILESIYMLSDLKSPRNSTMTDLINFNSQNFEILRKTGGEDMDEILKRLLKFKRGGKRVYLYYTGGKENE